MVLATVRHSGSHFALKLFEKRFTRHALTEDLHGEPLYFAHCEPLQMGLLRQRIAESPPLVLTIRNPMEVAKSWIKRKKPMDHIFRAAWGHLFRLKGLPDSFWLPVDTPDRETRLELISERLGPDFHTDWHPVGSTGNNFEYREGMTLEEAKGFYRKFDFAQFGYSL